MNTFFFNPQKTLSRWLYPAFFALLILLGGTSLKAQGIRIDPASVFNLPDTVQYGDTLNDLSVQVINDGPLPLSNILLEIRGGINNLSNVISFGDTLITGPVIVNPGDSITVELDQFIVSPQNSNNGSNVVIVWPTSPNENGDTIEDEYHVEETATALWEAAQRQDQLSVWPNPATGEINFDFNTPGRIADQIQIRNMQGVAVLVSKNTTLPLDVSGLPKGAYILEIRTKKGNLNFETFLKH